MIFRLVDFKLPATVYAIYLFETGMTEREFLAICSKLRYFATQNGVSWLAVFSTTESCSAERKHQKSGTRGRPKKCVVGKKVNPHCHLSVIGSPIKSAYNAAVKFKKSVDKKSKRKVCRVVSKGNQLDARVWIGYCLKQADILRSGCNFDFQHEGIIL